MTAAEWFVVGAVLVGALEHIIAVTPIKENSTVQLLLSILKRVFPAQKR
tara:strand:+ start:17720 stop:17866 length:147 start_codon:yes stop_codon:yes gene_type:complete